LVTKFASRVGSVQEEEEPVATPQVLQFRVNDLILHLFLILEIHPDLSPPLVARLTGACGPPEFGFKVREVFCEGRVGIWLDLAKRFPYCRVIWPEQQ
jgi:hypothetical protein